MSELHNLEQAIADKGDLPTQGQWLRQAIGELKRKWLEQIRTIEQLEPFAAALEAGVAIADVSGFVWEWPSESELRQLSRRNDEVGRLIAKWYYNGRLQEDMPPLYNRVRTKDGRLVPLKDYLIRRG